MIFQIISRALEYQETLSLSELCRIAKVSRSGYYNWKQSSPSKLDNIDKLIYKYFYRKNGKVGYRTIKMYLKRTHNLIVNHKKILLSMRMQGLKTQIRKKKYNTFSTTIISASRQAFKNSVKGNFSPLKPDMIYSADVTEFKIKNSQKIFMYAVKDLCTKEIVAHNTSINPDVDLVTQNLEKRLLKLPVRVRKKLIYHTDQGTVFLSNAHISLTKKMKVTQSMSRRGNCLDNAPIESFFGHFKDEVDFKSWKNFEETKRKVDAYIKFYNNDRPQWELKRKTPAECRSLLI